MRILFAMLVSACLAAVTQNSFFQYLLLNNYYGNNKRVCRINFATGRRRCHNKDNNLLRFAPFFLTVPTPAPPPGCFPDSAVFERLTKSGHFEHVHPKDLVLGDEVKCLKAPDAFLTERLEVGACKFVARQHSTDETLDYHTVSYLENGIEKSISMTRQHVMWATQADNNNHNESVVAAKDVKLDPQYLIPIEKVLPGDLILVEGEPNTLEYRQVISHKIEKLEGINLPGLTDGGLPFVNGVLATTTARAAWGGHWVNYFKRIWLHDVKFADPNATYWNFVESPLTIADVGHKAVDNDCFLKKILADKRAGVNITDFDSYDKFATVYMAPCISEAERAKIGAEEMREW